MPDWATFAAFAGVVTTGLLILSFASRGVVSPDERPAREGVERDADARASEAESGSESRTGWERVPPGDATRERRELVLPKSGVRYRPPPRERGSDGVSDLSTAELLANVAVSQGLFAVVLLCGAWYARVPASAFGATLAAVSAPNLAVGAALGVALYVVNQVGAAVGAARGLGSAEELRESLAPETPAGWAVLLLVVLPLIAGFEELLFRGALVGVFAVGFGASPWLLAVVSSAAFALGHNAQGRVGVVVTGALGSVLAAAFVLTGSLFAVVLAHYLVNALEFVVHEGLEIEWTRRLRERT